jgi:cell division protein FtsZ
MDGSQNSNNKNSPTYQTKVQNRRTLGLSKQKKLDVLNLKIELVEQQRIGLAKKIALAELERDRLQLEARRIVVIEALKDGPGIEVMSITESATAKVNAYLEESRRAVTAVESERCKLLDEAKKCLVIDAERNESKNNLASGVNPSILYLGGVLFAAVGARMALQNRDEKQLEMKKEFVDATDVDEIVDERKNDEERLIADCDTASDDDLNNDQNVKITDEEAMVKKGLDENGGILSQNKTDDLGYLVNDLQITFDEAQSEAMQPNEQNKKKPSETSEISISLEGNVTIPEIAVMNGGTDNESNNQSPNDQFTIETLDYEGADTYLQNIVNITETPLTEIPDKVESRLEPIPMSSQKRKEFGISSIDEQNKPSGDSNAFALSGLGSPRCNIKVLGVGNSGGYSLDQLISDETTNGVEFWAVNSDTASLGKAIQKGAKVCFIGPSITEGKGANGFPEIGKFAAEESAEDIYSMVEDSDVCIVTTGLGSGTGSGAAPIICKVARDSGALTIAVVTKPFPFEGRKSMRQADDAIDRLRELADAVIVISNSNVLKIIPGDMSLEASFRVIDAIIHQVIVGLVDMLSNRGLSMVDFADVNSVLKDGGISLMGMGTGLDRNAAEDATIAAMTSPLLDAPLNEASGVLVNIVGGKSLSLQEIDKVIRIVDANVNDGANVIVGARLNCEDLADDAVSVTIIATSFKKGLITRYIRDYVTEAPA